MPFILGAYDSRVDNLVKVKNLFSALDVAGTTPEGLCFEAIQKDLIPGNSNQDSYFINFSDGQPYYGNNEIYYCGKDAEFIKPTNMMAVAKTMNKKFLSK